MSLAGHLGHTCSDRFHKCGKGKDVMNVHERGATNSLTEERIVQFTPMTTPSNLDSAPVLQFQIQPSSIGYLKSAVLELDCANPSGANTVQPYPAPLWIDYIELRNSSAEVLSRVSGTALWLKLLTLNDATSWATLYSSANSTAAMGLHAAWAISSSKDILIPLTGLILENVYCGAIQEDLTLFIQFQPLVNMINAGTSPSISLTAARLTVSHSQFPSWLPQLVQEHRAASFKSPLDYRVYTEVFQRDNRTLSSGLSFQFQCHSLTGAVSHIFAFVRTKPFSSAGNISTFRDYIDTIALTDASGVNLYASNALKFSYLRNIQAPDNYEGSEFFANHNVALISFSSDPLVATKSGSNFGFKLMTGNEKCEVICNSSATSNCDTELVAYKPEVLRIANGRVTMLKNM